MSSKTQKPLKRAKIKSQGESERSKITREADRVFSIWIRKRNSVGGRAKCVTCGGIDNYKNMDNGHYISRRFMSVRYDERNCNVQCRVCNRDLKGNLKQYKIYLMRAYGIDILDKLKLEANSGKKLSTQDIKDIITRYK